MTSAVLHQGATVACSHGGQAMPGSVQPRVQVSGQAVVTVSPPYQVSGCPFTPANGGNGPCVTGQWFLGALRVKVLGDFLALEAGTGLCAPTGAPLAVRSCQQRVTAA